jgi:four helix bundle protein
VRARGGNRESGRGTRAWIGSIVHGNARPGAQFRLMGRAKLVVKEKAEQLVAEIARLRRKLNSPGNNAALHLEKAGDSVLFNLGEGIACFAPKLKASKYEIARAEAREVQQARNALVLTGELSAADVMVADDLADCVIAMLTNMIKNLKARL